MTMALVAGSSLGADAIAMAFGVAAGGGVSVSCFPTETGVRSHWKHLLTFLCLTSADL